MREMKLKKAITAGVERSTSLSAIKLSHYIRLSIRQLVQRAEMKKVCVISDDTTIAMRHRMVPFVQRAHLGGPQAASPKFVFEHLGECTNLLFSIVLETAMVCVRP